MFPIGLWTTIPRAGRDGTAAAGRAETPTWRRRRCTLLGRQGAPQPRGGGRARTRRSAAAPPPKYRAAPLPGPARPGLPCPPAERCAAAAPELGAEAAVPRAANGVCNFYVFTRSFICFYFSRSVLRAAGREGRGGKRSRRLAVYSREIGASSERSSRARPRRAAPPPPAGKRLRAGREPPGGGGPAGPGEGCRERAVRRGSGSADRRWHEVEPRAFHWKRFKRTLRKRFFLIIAVVFNLPKEKRPSGLSARVMALPSKYRRSG